MTFFLFKFGFGLILLSKTFDDEGVVGGGPRYRFVTEGKTMGIQFDLVI